MSTPNRHLADQRQSPSPTPSMPVTDMYKWHALAVVAMFFLTLPAVLATIVLALPAPPLPAWTREATTLGVEPRSIILGEMTYGTTCAVCHGKDAEGLQLLGKPLRNSAFVQSQTDEQLLKLLISGRTIDDPLNTSGALMPPRGAQNVDDEHLARVVLFLRAIQDVNAPPTPTDAWNIKDKNGGNATPHAVALADHPGYNLFVASCSACHGEGAQGIDKQGLPLTTSGFVRGKSDKDLITFIKSGRPAWDAANTTGIDMPPKGGNPAITDDQLQTIVDYIRAVQNKAMGS